MGVTGVSLEKLRQVHASFFQSLFLSELTTGNLCRRQGPAVFHSLLESRIPRQRQRIRIEKV